MKKNILTILFLLFFVFQAESKSLTYTDIVSKIYDFPALANLPEKGEEGALFSSYDRKSKYDEKTDSYINWEANGDNAGIIRQESNKLVFVDIKGPGVIWRMWSAMVGDGKVQIYLDGELVCDLPFKDYFNGKIAPFNRKGLVYEAAKGWNNYTPISFQKSCKITADPKWGAYYHFNYTVFPKETKIQTFKMKFSPEEMKALDKANEKMTVGLGKNPVVYKSERMESLNWTIPAGKSKSLIITGKRAITSLKVQVPKHKNYNDLLRQLTLSINWDNQKEPAVWSPLGDFFGTAPGINLYKSLVMGMEKLNNQYSTRNSQFQSEEIPLNPPLKKGDLIHQSNNPDKISNNPSFFQFYSYWYMPFKKRAEITIKNESDKPQKISLLVKHTPVKTSFDKLGYFHAKWHRDLETNTKRPIDWKIMEAKGSGRFVGVALHIWNARGGWWGEGDEKFFVDGEKFPSTIGTGSEDYFGYAWCDPEVFVKALHSQPTNKNNRGQVSVSRWHIGDNIPFHTSFEADIEKYFPNSRETFYDCVAYWYLSNGGTDNIKETPLKNRLGYYTGLFIYNEKNAFEAELYKKIKKSNGKLSVQNMWGFGSKWSNDSQLWWTRAKPGDYIEFEIYSPKSEEKNLVAQFTKAKDYGIIQLYFNGKQVGDEIDCYSRKVIPSGKINFGKVRVKKGENIFKIKIIGANPKAIKSYMVGLDYLKFE